MLLKRLFDQNEQAIGLFYLHPDADIGIGEPAVAFLRQKIALESRHYDLLVSSRTGHLDGEFRAKLGWLLGNLYGRAATPDWKDRAGGDKALDDLIQTHLRREVVGVEWIDDETLGAAREAGVPMDQQLDVLLPLIHEHRPQPRIEQVVDIAVEEARSVLGICTEHCVKFRKRLLHNARLKKLAR